MATDTIIEFRFEDEVQLARVYVKFNSQIDVLGAELAKYFEKADEDNFKGRLNWDHMVSSIVKELLTQHRDCKLVAPICSEYNCIYYYVITPVQGKYSDVHENINEVLNLTVKYALSQEVIAEGSLKQVVDKAVLTQAEFEQ